MKTVALLFAVLLLPLLGCTGDCMSCHPKLMKTIDTDSRHSAMKTCIQCHAANPEKMADCGSDCFACHPAAKIEGSGIKEHTVIRECRECHMKIKASLKIDTLQGGQSLKPVLRDFLLH